MHGLQLDAPEERNWERPAAQLVQLGALAAEYLPASQNTHAAAIVTPERGW